jgi:hypothetical protein
MIFGSKIFRRRRRMNRFEGDGFREAKLRYLDGDYQIVTSGAFVVCAMTGLHIPLDELRYWSVARQEAYANPDAVMVRLREGSGAQG